MSSLEEHLRAVEEGLSIARDVYRGGVSVTLGPGMDALWDAALRPVILLPDVSSRLEVKLARPSGPTWVVTTEFLKEAYPALFVECSGGVSSYYVAWNMRLAAQLLEKEMSLVLSAERNVYAEMDGMPPTAYVCLGDAIVLPFASRSDLEVRLRLQRA
ncbi:hypothetical protein J4439_08085 [Candidatus Woesearchaeota archaeon]|nr:hypothetical protein [Candidatus Woesearchaeota archaeon]